MHIRITFASMLLLLAACSRTPPPGQIRVNLESEQDVSVGLYEGERLIGEPVVLRRLGAGQHLIDVSSAGAPAGKWTWRAVGVPTTQPEFLAAIGNGFADPKREDELASVAGGDAGPPCAVAADAGAVFLGWRAAEEGHEVVAVDSEGRVLWGHHHGPGKSGVRALAAADGVVFVLASGESEESIGSFLYKLDAKSGAVLPWAGRDQPDLRLVEFWGAEAADPKPERAQAVAAKNGRAYVTFAREQFIAAIDASTGAYVITLSGPDPGQMALSTTPMTDPPKPGEMKVIDFGVCVLAGNGIAYFVMEHDPAWVMASTTRWLQEDERIVAIALTGDTMKSGEATIYTGIGDPHHQVQLRTVDNAETFATAVGRPGGRPAGEAWDGAGFRDIQAIAVDSAGQLWVGEGDEKFGRFSVWKTAGKDGTLVREYIGPIRAAPHADPQDPAMIATGNLRWTIDPAAPHGRLAGFLQEPVQAAGFVAEYRDGSGLVVWKPATAAARSSRGSAEWRVWRTSNGRTMAACTSASGTLLYALHGADGARSLGSGAVTIPKEAAAAPRD